MAATAPGTTGSLSLTTADRAFIASAVETATSGGPVGVDGPSGALY